MKDRHRLIRYNFFTIELPAPEQHGGDANRIVDLHAG